jgi:hypothetical protein
LNPSEFILEFLQGGQTDPAGAEHGNSVEVPWAAQAPVAIHAPRSGPEPKDEREEKIDLWMRNIKDFIRNIDVKSL